MGKFCLPISLCSARRLIPYSLLLVGVAGISAQAASNRASAVLHIQVTVIPAVQTTTSQPNTTGSTSSVTYILQPVTAPRMTSQVTVQQISTSGPGAGSNSGQSAKTAVLKTTTVVPE